MRCPFCSSAETQVKDSRPTEENAAIRRRRVCPDCGGRFTTFERVQLRELTVAKRSGRKVAFDRDKLSRSIEVALRKRPVDADRIDRMVSGIVRQLESSGQSEITSEYIGTLVMEALRGLDPVAYVRFVSVYRDFREASDFEAVLGEIAADLSRHEGDGPEGDRPDDDAPDREHGEISEKIERSAREAKPILRKRAIESPAQTGGTAGRRAGKVSAE